MFEPNGIDPPLIYRTTDDGDILFERQSLDCLIEEAWRNPRTAVSNQKTGRYAVASAKGFTSVEDLPRAELIVIRPTSPSIIEIVPMCIDIPKIRMEVEDSVVALEKLFELYPQVSTLPSKTLY